MSGSKLTDLFPPAGHREFRVFMYAVISACATLAFCAALLAYCFVAYVTH